MNKLIWLAIFVVAITFASGSISAQKSAKPKILRTVETETRPNAKIEAIIKKQIDLGDLKKYEAQYYYNFVDLNNDKKNEVLVYIEGFVSCGTGGCPALLLTENDEGDYELLNYFSPVRSPIIVSENKTKGWKDLVFQNSGGGIQRSYFSVCRFNGKSYPENPTVDDEVPPLKTRVRGVEYLASEKGIKILP